MRRCPICKAELRLDDKDNPAAPFCSPHCRTIDLGRWLTQSYVIPEADPPGSSEAGETRPPDRDPRGEN